MAYRSYEKINGQILAIGTFEWASTTYARMLILASEVMPDSVDCSQYVSVSSFGTTSVPATGINHDFIIPDAFDYASTIDGYVRGNVKISIYGYGDTGDTTAELNTIKVQLKAISSDGTSRDLTDLTTVWSGSVSAVYESTQTKSVMFWIPVNASITVDERLVLNVQTTGRSGSSRYAWHRLYADKNTDTLSITLPFVII